MAENENTLAAVRRGEVGAVQEFLVQAIAEALETDPQLVPLTTPLTEMGFDSLMAIMLKNQVELDLHLEMPMVKLMEGPTVQELSASIAQQLAAAPPVPEHSGGQQAMPSSSVVSPTVPVEEEPNPDVLRRGGTGAVQKYLVQAIAEALETDPELVPLTAPLIEMGFDSLMAVVLKNQVELDLDLEIPMVKLMEGPTVQELSAFIATELAATADGQDAPARVGAGAREQEWEEGEL